MASKPPTGWQETKLRAVVEFFTSGEPFLKLEYTNDGIPVLAKGDVKPFGRLAHGERRFINKELAASRGYRRTRGGDYLLTTRDLTQAANFLGLLAPIPRDRAYLVNQGANIVRFLPEVNGRYMVYWCNGPIYREYIKGHFVGSTQIHIRKDDFLDAPLWIPPPNEQRAISDTLAALDDRIDLLSKANETLESIAQSLFKSWFIDFDPVRAKAEGREPEGMDAAMAALFPAEFEESALGLTPKGWRAGALTDAFDINPSRSLAKGVDAPYLEMANAPTSGHRPLKQVEGRAFGSGCKFKNGDALFAKITPCLENGKGAFVDFLEGDEVGWGSTEFIVVRSKSSMPTYGSYLLSRHEPFRQYAIQAMTGTSGRQRVELSRLAQFRIAVPPSSAIADASNAIFNALQSRIAANAEQALTLAQLRDALLPRLISGKLRLPEGQERVEGALA